MPKAPKQMDQSQRERRKMQNRDAQRSFRQRKKAREEAARSAQLCPSSGRASPALDVSILEHPSIRLQIEIRHQKLVKTLEQYDETIVQGAEDQSVMQFATDNWPALQAKIESIHSHIPGAHHTTRVNYGAERESAISLTPRSHDPLFPSSVRTPFLYDLNRKLQCMLHSDVPLVGDSSVQYDSTQGSATPPFVCSVPMEIS